jgi:SAM-dependent methyltransferase
MHAIPLGRRGCSVIAIDSSTLLLEELRRHAAGLPVSAVQDDLLSFQRHVNSRVGLIVIMGDTLTHLPDRSAVQTLIARAAESLCPGGQFIATFRDYSAPLAGDARFIPVKSDDSRILTCFLEYGDEQVAVHDLLYERQGSLWQFKVSSYRKLRLSPAWVASTLRDTGLSVRSECGPSGMVRLIATRA